ncbi:hypothetical protein LBMAG53_34970 [Planctomycetota bacterium]|nr:hypothetical protein LBMAG53_34970 [Planctomycetota bacterium]
MHIGRWKEVLQATLKGRHYREALEKLREATRIEVNAFQDKARRLLQDGKVGLVGDQSTLYLKWCEAFGVPIPPAAYKGYGSWPTVTYP